MFLDIGKKAANAEELRNLYENREIKFFISTIHYKKLKILLTRNFKMD
jgi:hypothetical protein